MLRLVCDEHGEVWPDPLAKAPGRGAYLCMQGDCLRHLRDKHLVSVWRSGTLHLPQLDALLQRIEVALATLCRQYLGRQRAHAAIGHEAVRQRLHAARPLLVLIASDAGAAVRRDVVSAVERRRQAGTEDRVCAFPDSMEMGRAVGRQRLAVAALEVGSLAARLERYCAWHAQAKESR